MGQGLKYGYGESGTWVSVKLASFLDLSVSQTVLGTVRQSFFSSSKHTWVVSTLQLTVGSVRL